MKINFNAFKLSANVMCVWVNSPGSEVDFRELEGVKMKNSAY